VQNTVPLITGSKEVALVNEHGEQIGAADVFAAHRYPPQLHAASSVWLWRHASSASLNTAPQPIEVLFQQRSQFKPIGASWWGNTVCGNDKPNESYLDCARRRLTAEMSIDPTTVELTPLYSFTYKTYGNDSYGEYEFDQMFAGQFTAHQPTFTPNPDEVMDWAWLPITELVTWANKLDFPSVTQSLAASWEELKTLTPPHTFTHQGQNYTIAPWVILMLRDMRLKKFFFSHP
jgi:isopentenyl-diphosphate Delta-isomerase